MFKPKHLVKRDDIGIREGTDLFYNLGYEELTDVLREINNINQRGDRGLTM